MHDAPLWLYLNEHLADAAKAERKATYCLRHPPDVRCVEPLTSLKERLTEERAVLYLVMRVLNTPPRPIRVAIAWLEESTTRLAQQRWRQRAPHHAVLQDLEALVLCLNNRLSMWRLLEALSRRDRRLASVDLVRQRRQTRVQLRNLERLRLQTGLIALLPRAEPPPPVE